MAYQWRIETEETQIAAIRREWPEWTLRHDVFTVPVPASGGRVVLQLSLLPGASWRTAATTKTRTRYPSPEDMALAHARAVELTVELWDRCRVPLAAGRQQDCFPCRLSIGDAVAEEWRARTAAMVASAPTQQPDDKCNGDPDAGLGWMHD